MIGHPNVCAIDTVTRRTKYALREVSDIEQDVRYLPSVQDLWDIKDLDLAGNRRGRQLGRCAGLSFGKLVIDRFGFIFLPLVEIKFPSSVWSEILVEPHLIFSRLARMPKQIPVKNPFVNKAARLSEHPGGTVQD